MSEKYNNVYFVTGGGTGGHIYPAIAVADSLLDENSKIYYIGNKRNMEFELTAKKGYKFLHVGVSAMPRKFNLKIFYWIIRLLRAVLFSIRYIKKYKPNAVFATGGYVSAPMVFACMITKTPYIMHDCDAMPGLVTRKLCKRAKCVTLAFEKAKKFIPNKQVMITGNPIRKEFKTMTKEEAHNNLGTKNKLTLTIMGGSQGAKSINLVAVEVLKEFVQEKNIQIIFQTGKKNYSEIINKLELIYPAWEQDGNLLIKPYFSDMISVLKASDIVISRAGSLSLSEISASGAASILIPYPYAAANHQRINAKLFVEMGAGLYIEEKDLDPNKFRDIINQLLDNPVKMNYLKQNALYLAKFNATEKIVDCIKSI